MANGEKIQMEFGTEARRTMHSIDRSLQAIARRPVKDIHIDLSSGPNDESTSPAEKCDEETLEKVQEVLDEAFNTAMAVGLRYSGTDVIAMLQNRGILFRERSDV